MNKQAPILVVNTSANLPMQVQEELHVYGNGRSYLHIQAATNSQWQNQSPFFCVQNLLHFGLSKQAIRCLFGKTPRVRLRD